MAHRCSVSLVTDAAEWDSLFSRVEHPHMTQAWAYGEARRASGAHWKVQRRVLDTGGWRTRRFVFEREGELVAICQLFEKSLAGVPYATRLNRGPLFLGTSPQADVVEDVYRALRCRWRHFRRGVLVLAPALGASSENYRLLSDLGFRDRHLPGWPSIRVDLRQDEEWLFKNLRSTWRNRLRSAERSGLELTVSQSPEDVEWIIDRHAGNMREKDFVGPSPALLKALYQAAANDLLVYRARLGQEAVGGMMIYRFGHTAIYYVGWMGREGRKVNVGNFLYWQITLDLKRRGSLWFDLGGERPGATEQFKRGMRGEEYELLNEWLAF